MANVSHVQLFFFFLRYYYIPVDVMVGFVGERSSAKEEGTYRDWW